MYRWFVRSVTIIFCFLLLYALLNLKRIGTPLPDGSRLILVGTTHGRETHTPPPAPRTIGSVVRSAAGRSLWEDYNPVVTESDETLFWFHRIPGESQMLPLAAAVSDEKGNRMYMHLDAPYLRVPALACWGKEVRVTLYAADGLSSVPATTFTTRNEFAGKFKPFAAEPLPVRKKAGDIEITLEKFGNEPFHPDESWIGAGRRVALPFRSRIKFTARQNGVPPENRRIEWPLIEAPSGFKQEFLYGRRSHGYDQQFSSDGRRLSTADFDSSFSVPLPPENLRFTVTVTNLVENRENELVFPDVPVPEADADMVMTTATRKGSIVELDPPLVLHFIAQGSGDDRTLFAAIEAKAAGPFRNFRAGTVRDVKGMHGRPLVESVAGTNPSGSARVVVGNERIVSIHYIKYDTENVEFYVKPEIYEDDS